MSETNQNIDVDTVIRIGGHEITKEDVCELLMALAYHRAIDVALFIDGCCLSLDLDHVCMNGNMIQIGTEHCTDVVLKDEPSEAPE